MTSAKEIVIKPIGRADANACVERWHYSGKARPNSQLHLGAFLGGKLHGVMQFGPPLDRRKLLGLVEGTGWNEMLELNRMAFSDALPRNSESRALSVAMRLIRKHAPQVRWVVSFADGTQCGDGTIYRASGFVLTQIKENTTLWRAPDGSVISDVGLGTSASLRRKYGMVGASMAAKKTAGMEPLLGFQLRYIFFIDPSARERLTVPELPYSKIEAMGASMYRGKRLRAGSADSGIPEHHSGGDGAVPIPALCTSEEHGGQ